MFFRSERLFLRPAWAEDARGLFALAQDRGIARNLASVPWPYQLEDAERFVARAADPLAPQFLVTRPDACGSTLIGAAGLVREGDAVELGYWIGREFQGRGYATEAARAVLRVAAAIGHPRLRAAHFIDNPASGRVLEKLGFQRSSRIAERYSQGRGMAYPVREYWRTLDGDAEQEVLQESNAGGRQAA